MRSHPDADAFMRAYLAQPADTTARLVFADWLEETGESHSVAWAHFIRLKADAARHETATVERGVLNRRAGDYAADIRARLTISAKRFVAGYKPLLELLPATNITVRLAGCEIPLSVVEFMPESVARENFIVPLDLQERTLLIAAADPHDSDTAQKLEFILNRDIVLVHAGREDIQEAIDRHYGQSEPQYVDSMLVEFMDADVGAARREEPLGTESADAPIVRLVNLILSEAIVLRADRILIYPNIDTVGLRYRIDGEWIERDHPPIRLLGPITDRLALMGQMNPTTGFTESIGPDVIVGAFSLEAVGIRIRVLVTIDPSPDGSSTQLDITRVYP